MSDFRILTLDGGGSWALIEIRILMDIFGGEMSGHELLRQFDLIASNSGGSIVLGALAANMKLADVYDLIADKDKNKRGTIFVPLSFFSDVTDRLARLLGLGSKYDTEKKLKGISDILGANADRAIESLPDWIGVGKRGRKPHFVICAFEYDKRRASFFRSDLQSRSASFSTHFKPVGLAQAVHASANPPVNYFNNPAKFNGHRYWDGGIGGYNNPTLAAVIETLANAERYDTRPDQVKVLSLGTANTSLPFLDELKSGQDSDYVVRQLARSLSGDITKLAKSILDDPPDAASFHSHMMLGGRLPDDPAAPVQDGPVIRMNPMLQPVCDPNGVWRAPACFSDQQFKYLLNLDMDAVKSADVEAVKSLAEAYLSDKVPNQAIRATGGTLAVEIGHDVYSRAKQQAKAFGFF